MATLLDKNTLRTHLIIFLLLTFFGLDAQTTDSTRRQLFPDNRYGLFHQTIKDSTKKTVSTVGHYASTSGGLAGNYGIKGELDGLISYSLAYKSHLVSMTYGVNYGLNNVRHDNYLHRYEAKYYGFLVGESLRFKHLFLSLSTGIAYTKIGIDDWSAGFVDKSTGFYRHTLTQYHYEGISFPIECKFFILARRGLGFGVHIAENIVAASNFSTFYFGLSIVAGRWNISSRKK